LSAAVTSRRLGFAFWSFVVLMLALTGLFIGLGIWQVDRLAEKEALIATVTGRLTAQPYDLPPVGEWPMLDTEIFKFHPVKTAGHYLDGKTVLVFASLTDPKGKFSGPGYWVLSAFATDGGGTVFVNRGFVPQSSASSFKDASAPPGEQALTGIALAPEAAGAFTPGPDVANQVEWIRDPVRLATMAGVSGPLLGLTIDLPAGEPGALPQGGETTIDVPNNHLGYAFTWFGFALLTPVLLAAWVWRQLRPAPPSPSPTRGE
jgi:surfeit locus 1 family protein